MYNLVAVQAPGSLPNPRRLQLKLTVAGYIQHNGYSAVSL